MNTRATMLALICVATFSAACKTSASREASNLSSDVIAQVARPSLTGSEAETLMSLINSESTPRIFCNEAEAPACFFGEGVALSPLRGDAMASMRALLKRAGIGPVGNRATVDHPWGIDQVKCTRAGSEQARCEFDSIYLSPTTMPSKIALTSTDPDFIIEQKLERVSGQTFRSLSSIRDLGDPGSGPILEPASGRPDVLWDCAPRKADAGQLNLVCWRADGELQTGRAYVTSAGAHYVLTNSVRTAPLGSTPNPGFENAVDMTSSARFPQLVLTP